jgi:hypothetical protein
MTLPKQNILKPIPKENKDLHLKIRVTKNDKDKLEAIKDFYSLNTSEFFRIIIKEHFEVIQEEK